jgi:hypothetical protein
VEASAGTPVAGADLEALTGAVSKDQMVARFGFGENLNAFLSLVQGVGGSAPQRT